MSRPIQLRTAGTAGLILIIQGSIAFASSTGVVAGHVVDRTTGAGLRFTDVVVLGTSLGAMVRNEDGSFLIRDVPAGTHQVKASLVWHEPESSEVQVAPGDTTWVELRLAAVPIPIYKWSPCGPASEYSPDLGPEEMRLEPRVRIRTILGLRPPVDIESWNKYKDGGSIGAVLRDSCGSALYISWDGAMRLVSPGDILADEEPRTLYLGKPISRPGARMVPIGSPLEAALLDVMRIWADARVPRAAQDSLARIAFDFTIPAETREQRLSGLDLEQRLALAVADLVHFLEAQRAKTAE